MSVILRRLEANPFAVLTERKLGGYLQLAAIAACYAFLATAILFL